MVIPAFIIGGSALYIGTRIYRRRRKQSSPLASTLHEAVTQSPPRQQTQSKLLTKLAIGAGVAAVGGLLLLATSSGITPIVVTNRLITLLQNSSYGPLLFVAAYSTLPLLLFPSSLLTFAAGSLFGPVQGIIYTIIGSNISALAAYQIGRRLRRLGEAGTEETDSEHAHLRSIQPFIKRMQANPFPTVLTMHCLFLPYEFVSYGSGLLGLPLRDFAAATTIGMLPWTFSFVLAGASIESALLTGFPRINPVILAASGIICVGSLALAAYVNWRHSAATARDSETTMAEQSVALPKIVGSQLVTAPVTGS